MLNIVSIYEFTHFHIYASYYTLFSHTHTYMTHLFRTHSVIKVKRRLKLNQIENVNHSLSQIIV